MSEGLPVDTATLTERLRDIASRFFAEPSDWAPATLTDAAALSSLETRLEAQSKTLEEIRDYAEAEWREGEKAYQFAIIARAALVRGEEKGLEAGDESQIRRSGGTS